MFCSRHRVCDPFRVGKFVYPFSGGVAALNPRLISCIPSGCRSADSVSRSGSAGTASLELFDSLLAGEHAAGHRPALLSVSAEPDRELRPGPGLN